MLRAFEIPEGNKTSKGRAIQNLLNIQTEDKIKAFINVKSLSDEEYINNNFIILCTKEESLRKNNFRSLSRPRANELTRSRSVRRCFIRSCFNKW